MTNETKKEFAALLYETRVKLVIENFESMNVDSCRACVFDRSQCPMSSCGLLFCRHFDDIEAHFFSHFEALE